MVKKVKDTRKRPKHRSTSYQISVRIPTDTYAELRRISDEGSETVASLINDAVKLWLKNHGYKTKD